jgi:beta-N-acetylhexosaminidase
MVGMLVLLPRDKAVPQCIAAGCDMFLFARNLEEDYGYMMKGIEDGVITQQRLDDAVTRILALKAAIGLHTKQKERTLVPLSENLSILNCDEHKEWTRECADKSVTLVKSDGALPMSLEKGKRVLFYVIGDEAGPHNQTGGNSPYFKAKLEQEGFDVDVFSPLGGMELRLKRYDEIVNSYDWIVYFCALMTKSNQTTLRIEWAPPLGANCPLYLASVPTIFISMENPYHLLDVPRMKNFINAYTNTEENIDAIIKKLMGRSAFTGKSPVDAFCGKWDTRLY